MSIFSPAIKQLAHFRLVCNHFDTKTKKTQKSENHLQSPQHPPPPTAISYQKYFVFHTVYPQHPPKTKNHTTYTHALGAQNGSHTAV